MVDEQKIAFNLSNSTSKELLGWGSPGLLKSRLKLRYEDRVYDLVITHLRNGTVLITDGAKTTTADFDHNQLRIDGFLIDLVAYFRKNGIIYFALTDNSFEIIELDSKVSEKDSEGGSNVFAPMHGNLIKVFAKNSQSIKKGDRLATLEAMKMQHELLAENDGIISSVHFLSGDQVRAGDLLFEIDLSGGE